MRALGHQTQLHVSARVVLMHYSPVEATVVGEPPELFPFLGCSRMEEPINRHEVCAVFHGHAHYGTPEGQTRDGIRVFNVAAPLLRRTRPDEPPVYFHSIAREDGCSKNNEDD